LRTTAKVGFSAACLLLTAALGAASVGHAAAQDHRADLERPPNPRSGLPCPSRDQYSRTRPDPPGTPTVVGASIFFQDVSHLNDVDQTVTADIIVLVRWRDPRLVDERRGDASADCPVPGDELWLPAVEPENLRSRQQFYQPRFLVDARGTVTFGRRVLVQVAQPLDLRDFPFDRHVWMFTLWPVFSKSDELVFLPLPFVGRNDRLSLQGWRAGTPHAQASIDHRQGRLGTFSRFDVTLEIRRESFYYVWKLGVPLVLIMFMAYSVYFIPPSAVAQQIGVSMTSMLTLIAYMLALSNSIPKISYMTRADKFYVGAALLVFFGLMKAILTIVWLHQDKKALVERADRVGRWLYPVGMLLNALNAFFL
jgi:hypothetical protein